MADLEFEEINRGNQPTQDGAGTDDAWTFTGKINRNFAKLLSFLPSKFGSAATRDVGRDSGNVMEVGAGGLLGRAIDVSEETFDFSLGSQFVRSQVGIPEEGIDKYFVGITMRYGNASQNRGARLIIENFSTATPAASIHTRFDGVLRILRLWNSTNTSVDSNGFIKEASPIIKLFHDKLEKTDALEIENAEFEKLGTGHYKIKNVPDLSRDGWYIETPKDRNNNIYFTLDYEELDGELIIKTYEPDYSSGRAENGAPTDILEGRFVSLRFAEDPSLYPEPEDEISEE